MTERELRRAFEDHQDAVYDFALRMTGSETMAEDIAQDCFLELLGHPGRFDEKRGSLRNFLFGIARNLVHRRWRTDHRLVSLGEPGEASLRAPLVDFAAESVASKIRDAVQALPPFQREAVVLFEYEGFTLEEIAGIADVDIGTVKSRLHRARERLRQVLAPLKDGWGVRK